MKAIVTALASLAYSCGAFAVDETSKTQTDDEGAKPKKTIFARPFCGTS